MSSQILDLTAEYAVRYRIDPSGNVSESTLVRVSHRDLQSGALGGEIIARDVLAVHQDSHGFYIRTRAGIYELSDSRLSGPVSESALSPLPQGKSVRELAATRPVESLEPWNHSPTAHANAWIVNAAVVFVAAVVIVWIYRKFRRSA